MATVLVIDDDPLVRRAVARILRPAGHDVVEAADGMVGVDAVRHGQLDLVITDIIMRLQDGMETIRLIREISSLPIIAMSGWIGSGEFDTLVDAKMLGADLTIPKPFTNETLLAAVETALSPTIRTPKSSGAGPSAPSTPDPKRPSTKTAP